MAGPNSNELHDIGLRIRKEVVGETHVDRAMAGIDDFNRDFQHMVNEYCWGNIWGRPTLSKKQRSLNNLCILSALNRPHEFKLHMAGALRNGCTLDEIKETLLQVAVYCGIPAGVEAFRLAREVLQAEGVDVGGGQ